MTAARAYAHARAPAPAPARTRRPPSPTTTPPLIYVLWGEGGNGCALVRAGARVRSRACAYARGIRHDRCHPVWYNGGVAIRAEFNVECDGCGRWSGRRATTPGQARRLASRVFGWKLGRNTDGTKRDLCPECHNKIYTGDPR